MTSLNPKASLDRVSFAEDGTEAGEAEA